MTPCASIGWRAPVGKARPALTAAQNLQKHRYDQPDRNQTRRNRDEIPDDALQRDRERTETENGDSEAQAR